MDKVFILWGKGEYEDEPKILGIFKTRFGASNFRFDYIRDKYHIEEDTLDEDLEREFADEFYIETFYLLE